METSVSIEEFSKILIAGFGDSLCGVQNVAIALSGGPDSMALAWLLSQNHTANPDSPQIHAITVDHGLRPEAAAEAAQVGEWVKNWPGLRHTVLKWDEKPASRIQEQARNARYKLMAGYCREQGIRHLFAAHHADDQAETFLFRLAKGSGLDGLAAMRPRQVYDDGLEILRPLLTVPKERLLKTCETENIPFSSDPSNESENFARVRIRNAVGVLQEEGLTNKRLAVTARRLARASATLEQIAHEALHKITLENNTDRIVLNNEGLRELPEEIGFRCIMKSIAALRPDEDYAPRMEKVEEIFYDLRSPQPFRKRTLGGLVFSADGAGGTLVIARE